MYAFREDQAPVQLGWLARHLRRGETLNLKGGWRIGRNAKETSPKVFSASLLDVPHLLGAPPLPPSAVVGSRQAFAYQNIADVAPVDCEVRQRPAVMIGLAAFVQPHFARRHQLSQPPCGLPPARQFFGAFGLKWVSPSLTLPAVLSSPDGQRLASRCGY